MSEEKNKHVIVAYTGDFRTISLQDYEDPFPAFRIEGIFNKKKYFEAFAENFQIAN